MTDKSHPRANLHTIILEAPDATKAVGAAGFVRGCRMWEDDRTEGPYRDR